MGMIANDMIEGRACSLCGCYFVDPEDDDMMYEHGHAVVCKECWNGLTPAEKKFHEKAKADTL